MPRARSPNRDKAYELWIESGKKRLLKDIAKELEVSETQVRKWKNQDQWEGKTSKGTLPKEKDKKKSNVTNKKGAPKGNQNAKGHGAPKGNQNNYKHGLYQNIYWDTLDDDELEMIDSMHYDEERLLEEQIALLSVRERRLLKSIAEHKQPANKLSIDSVQKRKMDVRKDGEEQYSEEEVTTQTVSSFQIIQKLEAELTKVQGRKTKCIDSLTRLRLERIKIEGDKKGNELVDDWISGVIGGDEDE